MERTFLTNKKMETETIRNLKENNPNATFEDKEKHLVIKNLWNDNSFRIVIDKNTNNIDKLMDTVYLEDLIAIYHKNEDCIEFIYTPVDPKENLYQRRFDFNYTGETYECFFGISSEALEILAKGFQILEQPGKSYYRNLREYNDFFNLSKQPNFVKEYFKNKKAISFYLKGRLSKLKNDFTHIIKSINFYLTYYDRNTPSIVLLQKESNKIEHKLPCYSLSDPFPEVINAKSIETTILDILNTAHETRDLRLQFIFYFQILEYCSYYYLENDIRQKLFNILKRPDINLKANVYSKNIIEDLQDHFSKHRGSTQKMGKTILTYCAIDDIKLELRENIEYFCKDITFDGGLKISKLFRDKDGLNTITDNTLVTIQSNIEKIRNVLVHLRESKENKVILPSGDNDKLIIPYLFILRRLAEKVAISYE